MPRHLFGDGFDLLRGFHCARPGGHDHFFAAEAHAGAHLHEAPFRTPRPAGQLVRLGDLDHIAHATEQFDLAVVEIRLHADDPEHGVLDAGRAVHVEAQRQQPVNHMLDLGFAGVFLHYDNHRLAPCVPYSVVKLRVKVPHALPGAPPTALRPRSVQTTAAARCPATVRD